MNCPIVFTEKNDRLFLSIANLYINKPIHRYYSLIRHNTSKIYSQC